VGIGPICRGHANAALAQVLPHDNAKALGFLDDLIVSAVAVPVLPTINEVRATIQSGTDDFRATIKSIAWMLSFPTTLANRNALVGVVKVLGYLGFAALLEGEASTGKAHVEALAGCLHLFAPRCKAGREAFKATVKGATFHPENKAAGTKASWSAPVTSAAAFWTVVRTYWPCAQGDLATLTAQAITQALEEAAKAPAPVAAPAAPVEAPKSLPAAPKVTVLDAGNGFYAVKTPYVPAFVTDIKTLPYKARYWDPIAKVWMVAKDCGPSLHQILAAHFDNATF